jgi:transcriptional regulator with XRE-family HTH domain
MTVIDFAAGAWSRGGLGRMSGHTPVLRRAVGEHLRRVRQQFGYTLDDLVQLAAKDGVKISRSTLHRIEQGQSVLPLDTVAAIANALGTSLAQLDYVVWMARPSLMATSLDGTPEELQARAEQARSKGQLHESLLLYQAAYDRRFPSDGAAAAGPLAAHLLIQIADLHRRLRHYALSLDCAGQVLNMPAVDSDDRLRALLLHVAVGYQTQDFFRAQLFADQAERLLSDAAIPARAFGCSVIGNLQLARDQVQPAALWFEQAIRHYASFGDTARRARMMVTLGEARARLGDGARAFQDARDGLALAIQHGHLEVVLYAHRVLGRMHRDATCLEVAALHFEEGLRYAKQLRLHTEQFLCWHGLWKLAELIGDRTKQEQVSKTMKRMLLRVDRTSPEAREFTRSLDASRESREEQSA